MRRLLTYRYRRTTVWLMIFIGILAGIGLAAISPSSKIWLIFLVLPIFLLALKQRQLWCLICALIFGLCLGWWRGSDYSSSLKDYEVPNRGSITINVKALNDALYDSHKQLSFDASNVNLETGQVLPGKVQVSGFGMNAVFAGDELEATGKLLPGYGSYAGKMSFAKLSLVAHHPSPITYIRQRFTSGMQTALPEPIAPFAMGLLVGQRATLPDDIKQDLLMVGLTHIIAVSGYNLTIILRASQKVLGKRSKRVATFLSLTMILGFLLLAGASASIVRAAIVSVLSITAGYYGRSFKPLNLIALAAAITAFANPIYEWKDLSWYLSFLAFYGVMILSPQIQARWPGKWHENVIGSVALESVCAEIMSLPLILFIFGQMSLVGLPANVLVVTFVPLAMLFSLFAGLAGMFGANISGWFSWPAHILLNYMLDVAHIMAGLPNIFVSGRSLSLIAMLVLYGLIITVTLILTKKTKSQKADIITDINQPYKRGIGA